MYEPYCSNSGFQSPHCIRPSPFEMIEGPRMHTPRDIDHELTDERPPLERLRGSVRELIEPFEPVGEDDWDALRGSSDPPQG